MTKRIALFTVMTVAGLLPSTQAASPQMIAAAPGLPAALDTAHQLATVPMVAAELLHLPYGVVETVLAPLPGLTVASGLGHLGQGLVAPFKVAIVALQLPFNILGNVSRLMNDVDPSVLSWL